MSNISFRISRIKSSLSLAFVPIRRTDVFNYAAKLHFVKQTRHTRCIYNAFRISLFRSRERFINDLLKTKSDIVNHDILELSNTMVNDIYI